VEEAANTIAVLGVYFALIAVLAVAVETVVNWLKILIPWLQGKPSPTDVLKDIEDWLPVGEDEQMQRQAALARILALNKALKSIGEPWLSVRTTPSGVVGMVGKATTRYIQLERQRRAVIRVLTVLLGILFAFLFQIDTLGILGPLYSPTLAPWEETINADALHAIGVVLSGLAASAGSSFWHDWSARLRSAKSASLSLRGTVGREEVDVGTADTTRAAFKPNVASNRDS
jgi:hypothetical protein